MSHNPFYFWQLAQKKVDYPGTPIPDDGVCNPLAYKKGWQEGTVGRDEVYRAIIEAEQQFSEFAGYYPFPTYDCYEQAYYCTRTDGRLRFKLPHKKIIEIGAEQLDLVQTLTIDDTAYTDRDGDGIIDWFEITIPDESAANLTLFFIEDDWCDKPLCRNEIAPLCFEQSGDDVIVSGHSWLLVKPILYGNQTTVALDPNDLAIYADQLQIYRRTTYAAGAVRILSKPWACNCSTSEECYEAEDAELCIVNAEQGVVELKVDHCCCIRCIDKICVNYLSGDCGNESLIARLAAANLGRDVCCCENKETAYWMQDFVTVDSRGRIATPLNQVQASNFFGTRRGQLEAFRMLRRKQSLNLARL